jgi:hypothetical protein
MGKKTKTRSKKNAASPVVMKAILACEAISQDAVGKNSLHGIFDVINFDTLPTFFKPFNIFVQLSKIKGAHKFHISGTGPGSATIGLPNEEMEFQGNPNGDTVIAVGIAGMPVLADGEILFVVTVDGRPVGWPCVIHVRKVAAK